jgi:hypothetical protein
MERVSLQEFCNLVKKTVRLMYTDPLVHLIIDFIIKHKFAESYSFANLNKLESQRKQVQSALTELKKHGLLN